MKRVKERMKFLRSQETASEAGQVRWTLVQTMQNALSKMLNFLVMEVSLIQENLNALLTPRRNLQPVRLDSTHQRGRRGRRNSGSLRYTQYDGIR